jgi:hypothetical protein
MKKKQKKPVEMTRGRLIAACLIVSPFLLGGIWAAVRLASVGLDYYAMQSWVESSATIKTADLVSRYGTRGTGRRRSSRRTKWKVLASYSYEYDGRTYLGDRVAIHTGSYGDRSYQQAHYDKLKSHLDKHLPMPCFVNPNDPSESVLFRDIPAEIVGLYAVNAVAFGGVGAVLMGSVLYYGMQRLR